MILLNWIFNSYKRCRWHWTDVSTYLRSLYYCRSIIALYWFWLYHFPADAYNIFLFSRYICLYISLLLNDWSISIVIICCYSRSDWKKTLIMTHFCSNDSISIIKSITLVNALDLSHWYAWADFPSLWKQRRYLQIRVVSMIWLMLKNSFDIHWY